MVDHGTTSPVLYLSYYIMDHFDTCIVYVYTFDRCWSGFANSRCNWLEDPGETWTTPIILAGLVGPCDECCADSSSDQGADWTKQKRPAALSTEH